MKVEENRSTILCMFSGGIDSTGVLHRLMTDEKFKDHPLIVHHINIFNRENRAKAEAAAVNSILRYYKENSVREFLYTESTFNTTGFAPLKSNRFPFDMDICAFMAGNICTARKDIRQVAMGRTKTDVDSGGDNFLLRMKRAQGVFRNMVALDMKEAPEYIFPVVEHTKKEIWDLLPEEVRSNTWWCRKPLYVEGKDPKPCKKCNTCKDVKDFIDAGV